MEIDPTCRKKHMKKQLSISLSIGIVVVYLVIASVSFFLYGLPSLEGSIPEQLYSDSITYEQIAINIQPDDALISVGGNYLGPVLLLRLFDFNRVMIHYFNLLIVFFSALLVFKLFNVNRGIFLVALLSSPLLFFSTFGVNKEILLLPVSIFLLLYLQRRSGFWLIFSLGTAFIVRWQIVVFVLLVFVIASKVNPIYKRRWLSLIILTGVISLAYPILASGPLEALQQVSVEGALDEAGTQASGIYPKMQEIQMSYGYFLVVIPKSIQLLVGLLTRFSTGSIQLDFWNNFVIMFQSLHNLLLLGFVFFYKKIDMSENCFYLVCLFAVIFAVTPIFAPRYFFSVTIWLALWLALDHTKPKIDTIN